MEQCIYLDIVCGAVRIGINGINVRYVWYNSGDNRDWVLGWFSCARLGDEDSIGTEKSHSFWYRLRMSVAKTTCRVCRWVAMYCIIFRYMLGVLRFGSERSMGVVSVSINIWYCVDPIGKVSVVFWSGVWEVLHDMLHRWDRVKMSWKIDIVFKLDLPLFCCRITYIRYILFITVIFSFENF